MTPDLHSLSATPLYAGLSALLYLYLSVYVIKHRRQLMKTQGQGNTDALQKAIRVHGNCGEYTPLALILLLLIELQGAPLWAVHLLGIAFVLGRVLHAIGFGRTPQIIPMRQAGMILTLVMLILSSVGLIAHALI
ncbi:MAPEG family protein [Thalassobius sp. Cn5-15]|uniref:MAPEG family protein n=1 Tax=Thalassobius sp. Cn5-15 TaxID=2917763 RepID=UPI001EF23A5F|nr:MAPEG family protein [Thalassobius sp. Cn5-15]MCG7494718.1 MAPEG family protein [Thalassobius sp. Cn5-15]